MPGKFAPPGVFQLLLPIDTTLAQGELNVGTLQATLAQLFANAQRAITGTRTEGNEAFEVTGFGQQALFRQAVESCVVHFRGGAALTQFTRQLDSTVLASREQVHCGSPHRDECIEYGGHRIDQISASARSSSVSLTAEALTSGAGVSSLSRN